MTLDSPVFGPHGLLPDLDVPPQLAPLKDARLRHFLEHTAGLPGQESKEEVGDPLNCASGDHIRRISFQLGQVQPLKTTDPGGPVPREPGTVVGIDFAIVQAVIERLSGTSYQQYVLSHVFNPATLMAPRLFHMGPYDPRPAKQNNTMRMKPTPNTSPQ